LRLRRFERRSDAGERNFEIFMRSRARISIEGVIRYGHHTAVLVRATHDHLVERERVLASRVRIGLGLTRAELLGRSAVVRVDYAYRVTGIAPDR